MNNSRTVIVSILNWNTSTMTADCVASVLKLQLDADVTLQVLVIDNGSEEGDWEQLQKLVSYPNVELIRQPHNLGFAGGHNVAIALALARGAAFIWLVNSDSLLEAGSLRTLLALMDGDPRCGAASPVVSALHDDSKIDFCGAQHDWKNLTSVRASSIAQARMMEAATPDAMWLAGTVVLFRIAALRKVGSLNDRLFAYFEDDDIGIRLINNGWTNRMAFDARAAHAQPDVKERPAHYFYLFYRNAFLFYLEYTPKQHRRFLRLRLLERALFTANRLYYKGQPQKAEAALLGAMDGLRGKGGRPDLTRRPAFWLHAVRSVVLLKQYRWIKRLEG
jgi:GT2 family glycosyltransferase